MQVLSVWDTADFLSQCVHVYSPCTTLFLVPSCTELIFLYIVVVGLGGRRRILHICCPAPTSALLSLEKVETPCIFCDLLQYYYTVTHRNLRYARNKSRPDSHITNLQALALKRVSQTFSSPSFATRHGYSRSSFGVGGWGGGES